MNRTRLTRNTARTLIAMGLMAILSACAPEPTPTAAPGQKFTIETGEILITVKGDPALFEKHGGELLERITSVDPKLIKPGVGLWVEPEGAGEERPPLLLVGRVVAVEPVAGGYLAPAAAINPPKE